MNELSLLTGAGGGVLGSKILGWRTVGYVEYEKYCQEIIKQRIADGVLDAAPIFGDIRRFIGEGFADEYFGFTDIITGGFPCQPFSVAGNQAAENDPRNMWPSTIECIRIIRPRFVFLENVPGLLSLDYFGRVLGDISEAGYHARWIVLGADDVGANHRRKRLWILAHESGESKQSSEREGREDFSRGSEKMENTDGKRFKKQWKPDAKRQGIPKLECSSWWGSEPDLGRVAHGVAKRVDRLKAIGNGQVPLAMAYAFSILSEGLI